MFCSYCDYMSSGFICSYGVGDFLNSVPKGPHKEGAVVSKLEFHMFLRAVFAFLHHLITEDTEDSGSEQQNVSTKHRGSFHPLYNSFL